MFESESKLVKYQLILVTTCTLVEVDPFDLKQHASNIIKTLFSTNHLAHTNSRNKTVIKMSIYYYNYKIFFTKTLPNFPIFKNHALFKFLLKMIRTFTRLRVIHYFWENNNNFPFTRLSINRTMGKKSTVMDQICNSKVYLIHCKLIASGMTSLQFYFMYLIPKCWNILYIWVRLNLVITRRGQGT